MISRRYLIAAVVLALAGCGESQPNKQELGRAYRQGEKTGQTKGETSAAERVHLAHGSGYREGLKSGAELALPESVKAQTRYMVTYAYSSLLGWHIKGWLEMPLETTWRCEDLKGCNEITYSVGANGGGEAEAEPYEEVPYESESAPYSPPASPPTTGNFNEGRGYVVECVDGTLSHSGGIQGACSHHGGER